MKSTFFAVVIILSQVIIFSNFIVVGEDDPSSFSRINSNSTEFVYYAASNVDTVEVVGEWDDWLRHNLTYSNGIYSIDLEINPGFYCYKIIIDQTDWILDPSNGYRKYCDGVLNSGIIVENLSNPKISIVEESQEVLNLKLDTLFQIQHIVTEVVIISLGHKMEMLMGLRQECIPTLV